MKNQLLRWIFRKKLEELEELTEEVKVLEDELYFPVRDPYKYCMDDDDIERVDDSLCEMKDKLEEKQLLLARMRERFKFLLD